ncbi:YraN family protein [Oribacterium sp. WCC10]|uniref:YraN family protein n=1 Tax=Oribacterium sp. WCC10 TaxID=1855343 RepID=UPI000B82F0CE|nr:YraN family protein [Oribacterium sp. WCC10]
MTENRKTSDSEKTLPPVFSSYKRPSHYGRISSTEYSSGARADKRTSSDNKNNVRSEARRDNHLKGFLSETKASLYLEENGYTILERNFRFHKNEIDIIARDGQFLVFVEVKARKSSRHGYGCEAVDIKKQSLLKKVATAYLMSKHLSLTGTPCRFDVISIDGDSISLFKNAF